MYYIQHLLPVNDVLFRLLPPLLLLPLEGYLKSEIMWN
jgi:hypothetical protein